MLEILNKYHNEGLLLKQIHPELPLTIWNYSPKVQYDKLFDDVLIQCRGLVTDFDGNIIARPFKKFFNLEEHTSDEIPNEPFEIFDKLDGSLGILFYYADRWLIATRGSFTSPQAIRASYMLTNYPLEILDKHHTYLFEIIYPENRIVCQYSFEGLFLLAAFETESGSELPYDYLQSLTGFNLVKRYDGVKDYKELKTLITDDEEGYVVRFKNGFRLKIKGENYIRLHRIITNVSNRVIWEYLKDKKPLDELLDNIPHEFYTYVKKTANELQSKFDTILLEVENEFKLLVDKKKYAEAVKDNPYKHLLFSRLNSYSPKFIESVWDAIYPQYEKPFSNGSEFDN